MVFTYKFINYLTDGDGLLLPSVKFHGKLGLEKKHIMKDIKGLDKSRLKDAPPPVDGLVATHYSRRDLLTTGRYINTRNHFKKKERRFPSKSRFTAPNTVLINGEKSAADFDYFEVSRKKSTGKSFPGVTSAGGM